MKTINPWLKSFKPTVAATLAIVIAWGFSVRPVQAVPYVVTLQQVGPNVVATGSGAIDLTGLTSIGGVGSQSQMIPNEGFIIMGPAGAFALGTGYSGFSGPTSFGTGSQTFASSGTGDFVGIDAFDNLLVVPSGYVSGNALSDSSTYNSATFSSLGVTPGIYEWTWGTGANQNFTLDAVAPAVPDSGSTLGLLLVALGGLFGVSRFRRVHLA